ncbi:MAG TPA: amino acid adenylation domain-containing protein [Ktedonobacteraceae bacterium]|nr:amino acid adenylation domain-containing protein [Ktedonobacteraceae bacterium]
MPDTTELSEAKRTLLARFLRADRSPISTQNNLLRRSRGEVAPLSFGQQQLWLLSQLLPELPVYNERVTIHLPGSLDVNTLEQSLNEIIRRHEAWRTIFPLVDGQPVQTTQPTLHIKLPIVDLRHLPEAQRESEALRLASEDAKRPFDLANGPLLRTLLIQTDNEEQRLFLTLHHIIFDGITVYQLFLPELSALYEAFSAGRPSPLPELPIQYADFAIWQREQMQDKAVTDDIAYWKQQLAGAPNLLDLPTDHPRAAIPTYRGRVQPFALSTVLTDRLRALYRQEGVTLYMLLLAAFNILLYRYTEQEDILVGTATSGRKRPEFEKLMGLFMNMLVMRTKLSGNPTFRELVGRVRETTFEAQAHADIPFEYVVKELQPERSINQNPLFQVLFVLEPQHPILPSDWALTHMDAQTDISKFDLSLIMEDRTEGIIGRFEYSTGLFDVTTIERMIGHWQTLLESIARHPDQKISELALLTESERQRLLVEWNATTTPFPEQRCVHQLFEEQVERTPDAVALVFSDEQLTYRELNACANRLAHHLQQLEVGPEVPAGLLLHTSLETMIGLLGILKAGGTYVPLDPALPAERLAFMLQHAGLSLVLTNGNRTTTNADDALGRDNGLLRNNPGTGADKSAPGGDADITKTLSAPATQHDGTTNTPVSPLYLDINEVTLADGPTDNPQTNTQGQHLAYIIYTSGSTGHPKGVAITQQNLWHSTQARLAYYREPVNKYLLLSSLAFDSSVAGIFWTLCQGGTLLLPDETVVRDPFLLSDLIEKQQPSHTLCVPSLYGLLLEQAATRQLDSLQTTIVAGERCPKALVEQHFACLPNSVLYNEYGPTEATVWCTVFRCEPGESSESVPIGRPIPNTQVYILDQHLQPVPIGVAGELYIGGKGVARGYVHQPEVTSERFIAHPFSAEPGTRLYKTGDRVRYLPDGTIEFLDRTDHQVKVRGYRIELGEIEEVIRQIAGVRAAVVIAREDNPGDKRLVAYVVPQEGASVTAEVLQANISKVLPVYMHPAVYVLLEALPMLPNGKLNRKALPVPGLDQTRSAAKQEFVAPRTQIEAVVATAWSQVLGIKQVGIYDDFFTLGGHSLLAMHVVSRLRTGLEVELSLRSFFEAPTVAGLADRIIRMRSSSSEQPMPTIRSLVRENHRVSLSSVSPVGRRGSRNE